MALRKSCLATYGSRYNASRREGQAPVGNRSRENISIGNSPNLARTNIIRERFLNSSLVVGKTNGSKDSPLGVRHNKLRTPLQPIRESLKPQERVQRRDGRY